MLPWTQKIQKCKSTFLIDPKFSCIFQYMLPHFLHPGTESFSAVSQVLKVYYPEPKIVLENNVEMFKYHF